MTLEDSVRARVRNFVIQQFPLAQRTKLNDGDSLVESGIVDSMGVLELVTFIESEFDVVLSDEDVVATNFDSICAIADFIEDKLAIGS